MKMKKEIQEKLTEAINRHAGAEITEQERLSAVILTLQWVLDSRIITGPIDPVDGK